MKKIEYLETPLGRVADQKGMMDVALDFYKKLFAEKPGGGASLGHNFWIDADKVKTEENDLLVAPFLAKEIKDAVFSCYPNGALGPDGLPFLFYQKFLDIVGPALVQMFQDSHKGELDSYRLNFALVTLVPKVEDACSMEQFGPICLLNCSFKIFSKLLTIRLGKVAQGLVASNRSALIKRRYILESMVVAHEIVHSLNKEKEQG